MMHTERRLFLAAQYEKEERWLNEMAAQGWALKDVKWSGLKRRYEFERSAPGEYIVRIQTSGLSTEKTDDLLSLARDSGVEACACRKSVYCRKKRAEGEFELFTDNASRLRILNSGYAEVWCALLLIVTAIRRLIKDIPDLYTVDIIFFLVFVLIGVRGLINYVGMFGKLRRTKRSALIEE